ncbi:MAG TPA: hypothetical protein VMU32_00510 [Solirubrobacteraceae bacterium]|nr:hypothetical protein [Solirubrobacteraceae bacterium]
MAGPRQLEAGQHSTARRTGRRAIFLLAIAAALVLGAAATASASPAWKFNSTELTGSETILGAATSSSMTVPGATTTCEHFLYNMKISNSGGKGKGEITELPLFECSTNTTCSVSSVEAEHLPWPTHLTTVGGKNYLIVEKVDVGIVYSGWFCPVSGILFKIEGDAGGEVNNSTETATFDPTTFSATGTSLWVGWVQIEWNGVFPTEAFQAHREQKIEVG